MNRLVLPAVAVAAVLVPAPADAAPSCVAQSARSEHAMFGSGWGHDVIAALASDRDLLGTFGFDSFGKLASFGAHQDKKDCPADL